MGNGCRSQDGCGKMNREFYTKELTKYIKWDNMKMIYSWNNICIGLS